MKHKAIDSKKLGNSAQAKEVALRASQKVSAYQSHLNSVDLETCPWDELPTTDKKSYLLEHSYQELLADDYEDCFAIFSSSGSSGRAFYWPQLRDTNNNSMQRLRAYLESTFQIHEKRTMAIIGLALGSWIGGEHFSWALKNVAATSPYSFSIFSPGNLHDEIIDMIHSADPFVEQMLLLVCPSAIGHLRLRAEEQGRPLPMKKLRFLVVGEPFAESLRTELIETTGHPSPILSIYGSADTGVIGFESPASARIRQLLCQSPELAQSLGFGSVIPHLFHLADTDILLEDINGELCITKWQGIPLIRYNLHDAVRLINWEALVSSIAPRLPSESPETAQLLGSIHELPDLVAISGRSDSCLLLCGTNLTEAMLDSAIGDESLANELTGNYRARCIDEDNRQRLALTLEYKTTDLNNSQLEEQLYPRLISALGKVQPEFQQDWEKIYQRWDGDAGKRILKLDLVPWPELADSPQIKQRGIQS